MTSSICVYWIKKNISRFFPPIITPVFCFPKTLLFVAGTCTVCLWSQGWCEAWTEQSRESSSTARPQSTSSGKLWTLRTSGTTEVLRARGIPVKMMESVFPTSENPCVCAGVGTGGSSASSATLDNQETQDVEGSHPHLGQFCHILSSTC